MRSHFITFIMIMLLAVQSAGCVALVAGGAAGAGTVIYFKGQLDDEIKAPEAKVHAASISALRELKLPVIEDNHDNFTAKIKSKLANGTNVWISVDSTTSSASKLTIRVGLLGDEEKSRMLLDTIRKYL